MSAHIKEAAIVIGWVSGVYGAYRYGKDYINRYSDTVRYACRKERNAYWDDSSTKNLAHLIACIDNEEAEGGFYSTTVPSPVRSLR